MYRSKIVISTKSKKALTNRLNLFLQKTSKVYCRALKRKVSLSKLPECITNRKESSTARLQKIFVALDILSKESKYSVREHKGCLEYEILGTDNNGKRIYVHLREELSITKDRILFFISCY